MFRPLYARNGGEIVRVSLPAGYVGCFVNLVADNAAGEPIDSWDGQWTLIPSRWRPVRWLAESHDDLDMVMTMCYAEEAEERLAAMEEPV